MHVMEYFIIDSELDVYKDFGRYDISFLFWFAVPILCALDISSSV